MTDGSGSAEWPAGSGEQDQGLPPPYQQPPFGAPGYDWPAGYGMPPVGDPPPTYLIWARIAAVGGLLFSLILGLPTALVAMRHGRNVRRYWEAGNPQAALSESRKARTWAIVSTVLTPLSVTAAILLSSPAGSPLDFKNPATVAASIKAQLQKRISDKSGAYYQPGLDVTSVVCTAAGANTDRCVAHFSNGQIASYTAVISASGNSYTAR